MKFRHSVAEIVFCLAALLAFPPAYAAQQHLTLGINASIRDGADTLSRMATIGIGSVRFDVPWKQVEGTRGHYQIPAWVEGTVAAAVAAHIQPVAILDYGNPLYGDDKPRTPEAIQAFSRYAAFVVEHFKGRVTLFELWNEWETHTGKTTPGSPQDYLALAKVAYPAIKAANPSATVLMSGISDLKSSELRSGWIAHFLDLGGIAYVDAVSLHPYNQPGDEQTPDAAIHNVDVIYQMVMAHAGSRTLPVYVTEMGYSSYSGRQGLTLDGEAEYLARFLLLAAARPYIAGVWWYNLRDNGNDPLNKEHHFGLYTNDFTVKPSAYTYAVVSALLMNSRSVEERDSGEACTVIVHGADSDRTIAWTRLGGAAMTYVDSDIQHQRRLIDLSKDLPRPPARLNVQQ